MHASVHSSLRTGASVQWASALVALFFLSVAAVCVEARAQRREDQAPPLMKFIPPEDRARLNQENDIKKRVQLSLEMAGLRLQRAAQLTSEERFDAAATELGIHQALVEDVMNLLAARREVKNGKVTNRFRDIYKRVEMTLRTHGPRLETIRRSTPAEDAVNVRAAYDYTRRARSEALESFYGETVLPESPESNENVSGKKPEKEAVPISSEKKEQP